MIRLKGKTLRFTLVWTGMALKSPDGRCPKWLKVNFAV